MDTSAAFKVERLTDDNWAVWSRRIRAYLVLKSCDSFVERALPDPATPEQVAEAAKAFSIIQLSLSDRWLSATSDELSAFSLWARLEADVAAVLRPQAALLQTKLYSISMSPSDTVDSYWTEGMRLVEDLARIGEAVPPGAVVSHLINGLSSAFDHERGVLLLRAADYTPLTLRTDLRALEAAHALASRGGSRFGAPVREVPNQNAFRRATQDLSDITCHHCGNKGHKANKCMLRMPKQPLSYAPGYPRASQQPGVPPFSPSGSANVAYPHGTSHSAWLLDSGASGHMASSEKGMTDVTWFNPPRFVAYGDGRSAPAVASGNLAIHTAVGVVMLTDVWVVPGLVANLLSVPALNQEGSAVLFRGDSEPVQITSSAAHGGLRVATASLNEGLYWLDVGRVGSVAAAVSRHDAVAAARVWHQRLGHTGYSTLAAMQRKGLLKGCDVPAQAFLDAARTDPVCEPCVMGKSSRVSHPPAVHNASRPCFRVCSNIMGPMRVQSREGCVYVVTLVDEATGYAEAVPVRRKSDCVATLQTLLRRFATQSGHAVVRFRSDRGGSS